MSTTALNKAARCTRVLTWGLFKTSDMALLVKHGIVSKMVVNWLEIIHYTRQVSAGLINGRSEGRGAVWGAAGTQLCNVVLSQPQANDMVDVAAVLSRWHLVVLHEGGSRALKL